MKKLYKVFSVVKTSQCCEARHALKYEGQNFEINLEGETKDTKNII